MRKPITKWIKLNQFTLFTDLVVWVTQMNSYASSFKELCSRIVLLVKNSGFNYAFAYLKLVNQLTIQSINNTPLTPGTSRPWVKRDLYGLPTIIPVSLRGIIRDTTHKDWLLVTKATLTLIGVFRSFPTSVKPDLKTIISPFDGLSRTLNVAEIDAVLKELGTRILIRPFKGIILESAGANGKRATWLSHLDALAFIESPRHFISFAKLAISSQSYGYLWWMVFLIAIQSPFYLLLRVLQMIKPMILGRLSIVYDQAGKARVVAITNWWIQLALKPLHNSIFDFLGTLSTDGTKDQDKPLTNLLANLDKSSKLYSFDLSAATDRLPIELQMQILSCLGYDSKSWKDLLDIDWHYEGGKYRYAVGQPMGAYSSWAMLALTHHVIVRLAARRAGLRNFQRYAVLGDDVVINNDAVAKQYQIIMSSLGVGINLSKSVISSTIAEFAKRWKGETFDLSPIGSGTILSTIKDPFFVGSLITEGIRKGFFRDQDALNSVLNSHPSRFSPRVVNFSLWAALGFTDKPHLLHYEGAATAVSWYAYNRGISKSHRDFAIYHALYDMILLEKVKALDLIRYKEEFFDLNWFKESLVFSRDLPTRLLERYFRVFSPSYWLYALSFPNDLTSAEEDVEHFINKFYKGSLTYGDISAISAEGSAITGISIDWRSKRDVRTYRERSLMIEHKFVHHLESSAESFYKRSYGNFKRY